MLGLSPSELELLLYDWKAWARPEQRTPDGDWSTWLALAGRGWGKTRTGAEFVRSEVDAGARSVALVGETVNDVRETMIIGSEDAVGLLDVFPASQRPQYFPSRRFMRFYTGAIARTFSAEKPGQLRGPQFSVHWCDELCKWKRAKDTWNNLEFGMRKGKNPRGIVTTTPKNTPLIKELLKDSTTFVTRGKTNDNRANLAAKFLRVIDKYKGTRLGRQELDGELLLDVAGALWTLETIENARVKQAPDLVRVIIGVDPSVAGHDKKADGEQVEGRLGDECGIVALGRAEGGRRFVLGDYSERASPNVWARKVCKAYWKHQADVVVAESNNGGEMVRMVINDVDPRVNVELVHATRGKYTRAEPCAADYERGDVSHVGLLPELEDELTNWVPDGKQPSPNRLDALVWAWTHDAEEYSDASIHLM